MKRDQGDLKINWVNFRDFTTALREDGEKT